MSGLYINLHSTFFSNGVMIVIMIDEKNMDFFIRKTHEKLTQRLKTVVKENGFDFRKTKLDKNKNGARKVQRCTGKA